MRTADFDFVLPPELIAQHPAPQRDGSRLLVLHRAGGRVEHQQFRHLRTFFRAGDVLVLNNSRVIPARLRGAKVRSGGQSEILLLEEIACNDWWAMLRPAKRAPIGTQIVLHDPNGRATNIHARVLETNVAGHRRLQFSNTPDLRQELGRLGEVPLPPYITRTNADERREDQERYQTVFAKTDGSVAAPTAGLISHRNCLNKSATRACRFILSRCMLAPAPFCRSRPRFSPRIGCTRSLLNWAKQRQRP